MNRAELKDRVCRAHHELKDRGLMIYTWGNVSAIDRDSGEIAIKPSGIPCETLRPEDIVVIDLAGKVVEGHYKPSSDTPTHLRLYSAFARVGAIVHTHSLFASAWAQAGRSLPCLGATHADCFLGSVPCTRALSLHEITGDYETEIGNVIVETFETKRRDPLRTPAVLVNCHGPFTWGETVEDAVYNAVVLEEIARMSHVTIQINPQCPGAGRPLMERHYFRKHGEDAYYGQDPEDL